MQAIVKRNIFYLISFGYSDNITVNLRNIQAMAKTKKKEEKKLLLRLRPKVYDLVKKASEENNRSVNGEIEYSLTEKYA